MEPIYNTGVYFIWFLSTYFIVLLLLIMLNEGDNLYGKKRPLNKKPFVSIIVPAFNEENKIGCTMDSLKKVDYDLVEFIIINDGSTDATGEIVKSYVKNDNRFISIDNKQNRGKATSLNEGIKGSSGDFIACMDADSVIEPEILQKTLPYFDNEKVGAVTVSVELKNTNKFLKKIIDIEYTIGLSLFLKTLSKMECVNVTPGPFSIYRKKVLDEIRGFDPDSITEDLEIAYRLHKGGYSIANCLEAKVSTLAPDTFKGIYVQRRRWYAGAFHTLFKHRDVLFNRKLGLFGFFVPFSYFLVFSGLAVFYASIYLGISRLFENVSHLRYTDFNLLERIFAFKFDILATSRISFIGLSAFLLTFALLFVGIRMSKKQLSAKKVGILGFPLMFFLYQIFWSGAVIAVLRRRHVKWR